MLSYSDVEVSYPSYRHSFNHNGLSLVKITGLQIKDIICSVNDNDGEYVLTASILILEDGHTIYLQGEHDTVYLFNYADLLAMDDQKELENIYNTDPDNQ